VWGAAVSNHTREIIMPETIAVGDRVRFEYSKKPNAEPHTLREGVVEKSMGWGIILTQTDNE